MYTLFLQDEIISLPALAPPVFEQDYDDEVINEGDMKVEEVISESQTTAVDEGNITSLVPPQSMFKPIEYPALHIFVS